MQRYYYDSISIWLYNLYLATIRILIYIYCRIVSSNNRQQRRVPIDELSDVNQCCVRLRVARGRAARAAAADCRRIEVLLL